MTPWLTLSVFEDRDAHIVVLEGELDLAGAGRVEETLVGVAGSTVVADLRGLTLIDVAGIASLVRAKRRIEEEGHRLVVRGAHGLVARAMEATGFATQLLGAQGDVR